MSEENEQYAVVELMGHGRTAGRISRPSDWGGLLRVDVPEKDGYRTEYYGMPAIYSVKLVSKEIATAYAEQVVDIPSAYDAPIVTREQHQAMIEQAGVRYRKAMVQIAELQLRLSSVNALPSGEEFEGDNGPD